jgi:hypothetical protein
MKGKNTAYEVGLPLVTARDRAAVVALNHVIEKQHVKKKGKLTLR